MTSLQAAALCGVLAGAMLAACGTGDPPAGLIGPTWNLTSVQPPGEPPVDTTAAHAHVTFSGRNVFGTDGLNDFRCSIRSSATRIVVGQDCAMTAAGLAPGAPAYLRTAVQGMANLERSGTSLQVHVRVPALTLTTGEWVLEFRRAN